MTFSDLTKYLPDNMTLADAKKLHGAIQSALYVAEQKKLDEFVAYAKALGQKSRGLAEIREDLR